MSMIHPLLTKVSGVSTESESSRESNFLFNLSNLMTLFAFHFHDIQFQREGSLPSNFRLVVVVCRCSSSKVLLH